MYGRGHPDILVGDQIRLDSLDEYEGVIKVKILPPRRLDVPVLPLRMSSGKLMFPLCRSCCERTSEEVCDCTPGERSWIGTYHTGEVKLAVSKGYVVLRAYELHNFPPERRCVYDPANPGAGLFAAYVNAFLKIKQESSGYPREAVTPAQKQAYIDDYTQRGYYHLIEDFLPPRQRTERQAVFEVGGDIDRAAVKDKLQRFAFVMD